MVLYLVDDEKNIRESIKTYIPWNNYGITQVIAAKSGIEALEKMESSSPDIILSDIRMPKMNGIEFAIKVKELYPDCVIIFLSGYADKEYLKSAIQLQAFEYIEKPIDINSLQDVVINAIAQKKKLQKKTEHVNNLEKSQSENLHVIRQNFLNLLVSTTYSDIKNEIRDSIRRFSVMESKTFVMAYIKFNWPSDISDTYLYEIKNKILLFTLSDEWLENTLTGFNLDNDLALLIGGNYSEYNTNLLLNSLTEEFKFPYSFSIGLSTLKDTPYNIKSAYLESKKISSFQFYYGIKQIITYSNSSGTEYALSLSLLKHFEDSIINSEKIESLLVLDKIYKEILKHKPEISIAKNIYVQLFSILYKEASRKVNNSIYDFSKNQQLTRTIDVAYLLSEIHSLLIVNIQSYHDELSQINSNDNRVREITQYINKNFGDSQLSVKTIANEFELSQAYLCSYFKKETTITLNRYITNLRIEQAKYLLTYTNTKIYDIALQVGFCDTNYFSALFKKQVGITPLIFRKGN